MSAGRLEIIRPSRDRAGIAAFVGAGALLALLLLPALLSPGERQVQYVADDAYYYVVIARNWAASGLPTFDGFEPTSGFHLLHGVVLALFARLTEWGALGLARAAIGLNAALCLAGAFTLRAAMARALDPAHLALRGLPLLLLSATVWRGCLTGVEYGAAFLGASITWWALAVLIDQHATSRARIAALVLAPCVLLMRSDLVLLLAPAAIAAAVAQWRAGRRAHAAVALAWPPIAMGVLAGAFALATGSPSQESGATKMLWGALKRDAESIPLLQASKRAVAYIGEATGGILFPGLPYHAAAITGAIVLLIGAGLVIESRVRPRRASTTVPTPLLAVAAGHLLLFGAFYGWFFGTVQPEWYFATVLPSAWLLVIEGACAFTPEGPARRALATAAFILFVLANAVGIAWRPRPYVWQVTPYRVAGTYLYEVPADQTVGAWNAGILAAFGDRRVVNLDGLVNRDVLPLARAGRVEELLSRRSITWIADWADMKNHRVLGRLWSPGWQDQHFAEYRVLDVPHDEAWGGDPRFVLWRVE